MGACAIILTEKSRRSKIESLSSSVSITSLALNIEFTMAAVNTLPRKLWEHPNPESTQMAQFQQELERSTGKKFEVNCRPSLVKHRLDSISP